jgi:Spy/CpxP family protein refolding chaperone
MKKLIVIVFVAVCLMGALTLPAAAFGFQGCQNNNRLAQTLNLTADQQLKLLEIRQAFQKEALPLQQQMQRARLALKQLWAAQTLDQSQIQAKVKETTDLRIQLLQKRREMLVKVKTVLTADQLKLLEKDRSHFRRGHAVPGFGQHPGPQGQSNPSGL